MIQIKLLTGAGIISLLAATDVAATVIAPASTILSQPTMTRVAPITRASKADVVDEEIAIINGVRLLRSQLEEDRADYDWHRLTLKKLVDEELLLQKARDFGVTVNALEVKNSAVMLREFCGQAAVSDRDWESWLKSTHALSTSRIERQFYRSGMVSRFKAMVISDCKSIASDKLEAYCKEHPAYASESYDIELAFITDDEAAQMGKDSAAVKPSWISLGSIKKEDLADHLKFVAHMADGSISKPFEHEGALQIIKVVKKHPRHLLTMEERRPELEPKLCAQERKAQYEKFVAQLRSEASIVELA